MGLGALYGAGNIERGMRERILERLRMQQAQQQMDLATRGATRADQELELRRQEMAQRGEYQTAQLASINEARQAAADAANELRIGRKTGLMTPGQVLTGKDAEDLPSYLTQPEAVRELEAPPGIAAGEQGQPMAGTIASSPSIVGRRFVYTGTGPQQAEQSRRAYLKQLLENEPPDSPMRRALEYRMGTGEQPPAGIFEKPEKPDARSIDVQAADALQRGDTKAYAALIRTKREMEAAAAASRPKPDTLMKVEHVDPVSGRTVIEWLPKSEVRGKTFVKSPGAAAEARLASAQAVNQTGEDIIAQLAQPNIAALLGPAMGRFNTVRDFIGNPPPELAELAGSIESYALANMGVHGMRSAAGAQHVKDLLDKKHTPESLVATIRGLNKFSEHFMENEGRGKTGAGPGADTTPAKLSAAELRKKYGKTP
jgi:hypothetical protein